MVKGSEDASFTTNGLSLAGSIATYQIKVKNTGNVPITSVEVLDRAPQVNDNMIITCTPRGSQFSMSPISVNPLSPISLNANSSYSMSSSGMNTIPNNWTGQPTSCNTIGAFVPGSGNTIKISLPSPILPFSDYTFELKVQVPANAVEGQIACNSVALRCATQNFDGTQTVLNIIESGLACLTIAPPPPPPCNNCDGLLKETNFILNPNTISNISNPYVIKTGTVQITILKPVQEIRLSIADLQYSWNKPGCTNCKTPAIGRGCLFPMTATQNIGSGGANGYLVWDNYTGSILPNSSSIDACNEEIIWKLGLMLQPGTYTIPFQLTLPKPIIEDCCELKIDKFNLKVSLKDVDCKICESIIIPSTDDCCTGSRWTSKKMTWDLYNQYELSPAMKKAHEEQLNEILLHNKTIGLVGATDIISNPKPWYRIENIECATNEVYRFVNGSSRTFSASYTCNTSLQNCNSEVKISIKTLSGNLITVDNKLNSWVQYFPLPGEYLVTYDAYCGGKLCNTCTFKIIVEKNCCPAVKLKPSTITIKKFKASSTLTLSTLPLTTYSSSANVTVNLYYSCPEGCSPSYTYTRARRNAAGIWVTVPNGGGSGTSPLTIAIPESGEDRITIAVKCGSQVCNSYVESFILSRLTFQYEEMEEIKGDK